MVKNVTRAVVIVMACGSLSSVMLLGGCKKPPPPPPPPPPRKVEPPPPEKVPVAALVQTMKLDARVQFPDSAAPTNEEFARAVATFADALARGDAAKFSSMLDPGGKDVLDRLQKAGLWASSTGKVIEAVRISSAAGGEDGGLVKIAIQEPGSAYQLAWNVTRPSGSFLFTASPSANVTRSRASDFDIGAEVPTEAVVDAGSGGGIERVASIIIDKCVKCHNAEKAKGKLRLDDLASIVGKTDLIVPGDPNAGELIRRITLPKDDEDVMPKEGDPLSAEEINAIKQWIKSLGAKPEGEKPADAPSDSTAPQQPIPEKDPTKRNTPHGPINIPQPKNPGGG